MILIMALLITSFTASGEGWKRYGGSPDGSITAFYTVLDDLSSKKLAISMYNLRDGKQVRGDYIKSITTLVSVNCITKEVRNSGTHMYSQAMAKGMRDGPFASSPEYKKAKRGSLRASLIRVICK